MSIKLVHAGVNKGAFDDRPIKLEGWTLRHQSARPVGKPTLDDTAAALAFASAAHESSPYWVGDIVSYAESRDEWREKLSQAMSVTELAEGTLHNLASIARRVAPEERELSPSLDHSSIVAKMAVPEQRRWLKKAKREGWNRREFRMEVQASQKRGVISGTADLEGMFRVWSIDFPWKYKGAQPSGVSAQSRYPGMTIAEGIKMGDSIKAHTMKHAVAFFWVTAPFLYYATDPDKGPDPYRLIRSWGFEPKTGGVWDKVEHNFGNYLSIRHEHLIIATRGSCTPDRPTPMLDSVFTERKSDVHSAKPKIAIKMMERLYDGPYVEMFAREERKGWTTWGNQVNAGILKEKAG
jgi:N6-adenosine-specific RNA methylase IME4